MAAIARAARSVGRLARDAAGVVLSPLRQTASARSHTDAVQLIRLTSKVVRHGRRMPKRHAATGKNNSPPLKWSGVPKKAKSLVLICEDPDAPRARPFVHWMIWDMSPAKTRLPRAVERKRHPARTGGAVQGRNGTGKRG